MTVPAPHLIRSKRRDEVTVRTEEVVPLTAPVSQLRWPALAGCESETALTAANVMNNGHRIMKLVDVAVADGIAS